MSVSPKPLPLSLASLPSPVRRLPDMLSRSLFDLMGFVRGDVADEVAPRVFGRGGGYMMGRSAEV